MYRLAFGSSILIIAYLYGQYLSKSYTVTEVETQILSSWERIITKPSNPFTSVLLGVNSNVDLIVNGAELLLAMNISSGATSDHGFIGTLDELQEAFSYFLSSGAAAERAFVDAKAYSLIVDAAAMLDSAEWYIGGNAALMSHNIAALFPDCKLHLIGHIGPRLGTMLSSSINIPESCRMQDDEIHMILEYGVGDKWGQHVAEVASRFITSYDVANSQASMLEMMFEQVKVHNPELVIISGLHMLESQSESFRMKRLSVLEKGLKEIPRTTAVHLELTSMVNRDFVRSILKNVVPLVDSLGFNEQELLFASFASNKTEDLRGSRPGISDITDLLVWLLQTYGRSHDNPSSRLTRLHFHSLAYHAIATVKGHWNNSYNAVAAGARMAGTQACGVDTLDTDIVDLHVDEDRMMAIGGSLDNFDGDNPVLAWSVDHIGFVYTPVLVCKHPVKTVGLGDAISSTGLLYSVFKNSLKNQEL